MEWVAEMSEKSAAIKIYYRVGAPCQLGYDRALVLLSVESCLLDYFVGEV